MAKGVSFKKPGDARPEDIDAFVRGAEVPASTPAQAGGSEGVNARTSTGAEAGGSEGRKVRKSEAWGMPRPGERIAKLGVDLTEDKRRAFKAKAASEGRDVADLVREWIRRYLEGGE